ncbi:MAG: galactose mutarotase [Propionibacteriaceae bacterium]|nr:galactose mutarotase [Propionibacteriaceae bacterium]
MTVRLSNDRIAIEILPLGAALHSFRVRQPDGSWRNIVLGRPDITTTDISYFGASVGRLANRVGGSRLTLDGVEYHLAANEGGNQLHGGPGGFSERVWEVAETGAEQVVLRLTSPDGDQGYPGTVQVTARYALLPEGAEVTYTATTDAPTVVNLTAHPYFILGDGTIEDHIVTVPTGAFTPTDDELIPTGEIRPAEGTAFDLRGGRLLGEVIAAAIAEGLARKGGIDQNFVVDGEGMREHVRLAGPAGTLVVRSDAPALQLYSGEHLGRSGLAIEPQGYPDAPNHANFPSAVLLPGETYSTTTQWLLA